MRHFATASEGQLSRIRASMVRTESLADLARQWSLGEALRFGKGEAGTGGADKDTVLAGAFEALLGALYVDAGLEPCREVISTVFGARILSIEDPTNFGRDPKSALQEWAAGNQRRPPQYELIDRSGPDHAARFTVRVKVHKVGEAQATANSKQEAEKEAAREFMERYG